MLKKTETKKMFERLETAIADLIDQPNFEFIEGSNKGREAWAASMGGINLLIRSNGDGTYQLETTLPVGDNRWDVSCPNLEMFVAKHGVKISQG